MNIIMPEHALLDALKKQTQRTNMVPSIYHPHNIHSLPNHTPITAPTLVCAKSILSCAPTLCLLFL